MMNLLPVSLVLFGMARVAFADVALISGDDFIRSPDMPRSMSGLTHAGGDSYYTIAEDYGNAARQVEARCLYKMTIRTDATGTQILSVSLDDRGVAVKDGCSDLEAVAFDPLTGRVWMADETRKTIGEYDPASGRAFRYARFPAFLKECRGYWFEGLAISSDGLVMWAANEEALTVDGVRSSYEKGTTVRLVKFTRKDANDDWRCAAMYPYTTEKWTRKFAFGSAGRRGVSELVALPDGSLLVLERELSSKTSGTGLIAGWGVTLYAEIFQVTPEAFSAATNVKDEPSLLKAKGWRAVEKKKLWGADVGWRNFEGMCLGRQVSTSTWTLLALTDKGDESLLHAVIRPFVLVHCPWKRNDSK